MALIYIFQNTQIRMHLHETNKWLVFPHELDGLTIKEIKENKPELSSLIENISSLIK